MADINSLIARGFGPFPSITDKLQQNELNALRMQKLQQEASAYPEEQNWIRMQRANEIQKWGQEKEQFEQQKSMWPVMKLMSEVKGAESAEDLMYQVAARVNWGNLNEVKTGLDQMGQKAWATSGMNVPFQSPIPTREQLLEASDGDEAKAKKALEQIKDQIIPPKYQWETRKAMAIEAVKQMGKDDRTSDQKNFEAENSQFLRKAGIDPKYDAAFAKWYADKNPNAYKDAINRFMRQGMTRDEANAAYVKETNQNRINVNVQSEAGKQQAAIANSQYNQWTQEQKNQSFENFIVNKTVPTFPWRDPGRTKWWQDYNQYLIDKEQSAESVGEKQYYRKAMASSLQKNEDYFGATSRFVKNIDSLSDQFMKLRDQYGTNFGKLINTAVNNMRQGIKGSGELASLQQYLTSISLEVAKVESGELGIQAATESQQKLWGKIHDLNFNADDIEKVLNTSKQLGATRLKTIGEVRNEIRGRLGGKEQAPSTTSATIKFQEGTDVWDIPSDKADAFRKKHPNARQVQ